VNSPLQKYALFAITVLMIICSGCGQAPERPDLEVTVDIDHLHLVAGGPLYLRMVYRWETGAEFEPPFTNPRVYVHLLDPEKVIVGQDDHSPDPEIAFWAPGRTMTYQRVFLLPHADPRLLEEPFRLRVGLFEAKSPDRKHLIEEQTLRLTAAPGEPRLEPLEGTVPAPTAGFERLRLAPHLPTADYCRTGEDGMARQRLVPRDQAALARGQASADEPRPLGILTPGGTTVEFARTLPPHTWLAFSARSEGRGAGLRVLLKPYGKKEEVICEETFDGDTGPLRFRLTSAGRRAAWIRFEATGGRDVLWVEPALESRIPEAARESGTWLDIVELKRRAKWWNVLLVVQDAARADALSCYGNPRRTTPALDRLSRRSVLVTKATANAPYTLSSTASLFTGLYPTTHGVIGIEDRLPAALPHLAEAFKKADTVTAAVSASPFTTTAYGMNRGFDFYMDHFRTGSLFTGPEVVRAGEFIMPYLRPGGEARRYFLYTHFLEPHSPYEPPEPFRGRFTAEPGPEGIDGSLDTLQALDHGALETTPERVAQVQALYQGNLMFGDLQLARLLAHLRREGLLERTMIIVTSDHGEAFNEHGRLLHNSTVYQEMIHVPMVICFPDDGPDAPPIFHQPVETVDLTALLNDLFLLEDWGGSLEPEGSSFLPQLMGLPSTPGDLRLALSSNGDSFGLTSGNFKMILEKDGLRLYHLGLDPGEREGMPWKGLLPEALTRQALLGQMLLSPDFGRAAAPEEGGSASTLDETTRRHLQALGYLD